MIQSLKLFNTNKFNVVYKSIADRNGLKHPGQRCNFLLPQHRSNSFCHLVPQLKLYNHKAMPDQNTITVRFIGTIEREQSQYDI